MILKYQQYEHQIFNIISQLKPWPQQLDALIIQLLGSAEFNITGKKCGALRYEQVFHSVMKYVTMQL
jgi:hypothetical protein